MQQSRLQKRRKGVQLNQRQNRYYGTTKQTCKIASLKIAIIGEAHHGLIGNMGCMIDSHDKLLSAAFSAATFLVMHFTTLFWQSQPKCNIYSMNSFDVVDLEFKWFECD